MKSLTSKTVHGISWNFLATINNAILQIVYTAIMARLLSPSAFGLLAMAMVIIKFGDYFSKMGMAQAVVQKKELTNYDIRSVFTTSLLLGLLFSSLMFLSAPFFQIVFETEEVVPIIKLLSINFLLKGLTGTSLGLLGRKMDFKRLSLIEISTYLISNMGIGIYLAYNNYGVYSLIFAGISQQFLMLIIAYSFTQHDLRFYFNWNVYKPLLSFGSRISIISIFEYIGTNLDTFFIAKFLGSTKLGLYNRANNIVLLPTHNLTISISRVIFPAFSSIQTDLAKLGKAYLSAITLVSAMLFPICFGIFAASEQIVMVLLGEDWSDAIPILAILSLAVPFKLISHFGGVLCNATANLKVKLIFQVSYVFFLLLFFYLFRDSELRIFATILLAAELLRNIAYGFIVKKIIGQIKITDIIRAYIPGLIVGVLAGGIIFLFTYYISFLSLPLLIVFIFQIIIGLIALILFGVIFPIKSLQLTIYQRFNQISILDRQLMRLHWYKKMKTRNK